MKRTAKILMLGVPVALAALLLATPAEAHKRKHRHSVHHPRSHSVRVHHPRHHRHVDRRFRVPARLHRRDVRVYRPYYRVRRYYRPHRHHHVVYDFPVLTPRGYVYLPHHYCDGVLFSGGRIEYHGKRVHFGIDF